MILISIQTKAFPLHIVIDPGHGGIDSGAAHGEVRESDLTLKISLLVKDLLNSNSHFKTSLTRTSDKNISLKDRVLLAEKLNADILLSIHANASTDQAARGAEFYFQSQLPPDEESLYLAATENQITKEVVDNPTANEISTEPSKKNDVLSIVQDLKRYHRMIASHKLSQKLSTAWHLSGNSPAHSIRQAPFYVVTKANVPSVLVELGFITNPQEASKLMNPEYQKEIAKKIYQGLVLFQNDKPSLAEKN